MGVGNPAISPRLGSGLRRNPHNHNNMDKLTYNIKKSAFESEISETFKSCEGTLRECNQAELNDLYNLLFQRLFDIREDLERFDKRIEQRQEDERQAELAQREEILLQTQDGQKIKFSAPYGFDSPSHRGTTVFCSDLYDLHFDSEGYINEAFVEHSMYGDRRLTPEELVMCNSLMQRM